MGIPSYFRKIIQKYPSIVSNNVMDKKAKYLCFDFNCLIYRCIRAPSMSGLPTVTMSDSDSVVAWEDALLKEVKATVKEVWSVAGKPAHVFLAVDGVVPSAKIRQQRVRRFKSAWLRCSDSGTSASGSWDSNSITPGTEFMRRLTRVLEGLCKEKGWILSSVDEAGEGEHKVMRWLKGVSRKGDCCVVYGLDADLILLSMLTGEISALDMYLLREKQEFGVAAGGAGQGPQEYTFMNLAEFKRRLGITGYQEVLNYLALMSLMGNDFLPHSLTHKLGDDGHDCVLDELREMRRGRRWLVVDDKIQYDVLGHVCKRWSVDEDARMEKMIRAKRQQAERGVGRGMDPSEALPLEWDVEKVLVGPGGKLHDGWRDIYWSSWIHPMAERDNICSEYFFGCQWILDYYLGNEVNMFWMFPAWIPPLWSDLAKAIGGSTVMPPSTTAAIRPEEQLAMVLPLESWDLVKDSSLRRLPALAPQMWPKEFGFFSAGRRWLWECEARVPVLSAERLREILKEGK
jgi:5'-3' exonuclease